MNQGEKRSTLSHFFVHQDDILKALEYNEKIDCIYVDFSRAYDKVDHVILLYKIRKIGIIGEIRIYHFLTD